MKRELIRVLVLIVTVIFVFGVGCDNFVGPEGPRGPAGADGAAGAGGVPSPEMYAAIEQTLEAYFAGLNEFVGNPGGDNEPEGIEVFGDVFEYPVFVFDSFWVATQEHSNAGSLESYLHGVYYYYREYDDMQLSYELIAFGSAVDTTLPTAQSFERWVWTTAFVRQVVESGGSLWSEEFQTLQYAFTFDSDGVAQIRYLTLVDVSSIGT